MKKGTVKSWFEDKGYGFIVTEEDEDFFVNINGLHITIKQRGLRPGDRVMFDVRNDIKGEKAVNVRLSR